MTFRFYKTADDPLLHLQGVVSKGWVGGQKVDPEYFKLIGKWTGFKWFFSPKKLFPTDMYLQTKKYSNQLVNIKWKQFQKKSFCKFCNIKWKPEF